MIRPAQSAGDALSSSDGSDCRSPKGASRSRNQGGFQNSRHVHRPAPGPVADLLAAAGPVGDDDHIVAGGADGRLVGAPGRERRSGLRAGLYLGCPCCKKRGTESKDERQMLDSVFAVIGMLGVIAFMGVVSAPRMI